MNNKIKELDDLAKELGALNYKYMYSKLDKIGIYPGQPVIIEMIYKNEGISQVELSNLVLKKPATITTMLNRMEHLNYIIRRPDKKDKRIIRLYLTDKGKKCYEMLQDVISDFDNIIFNNITDNELETLSIIMLKIKNNLLKNK